MTAAAFLATLSIGSGASAAPYPAPAGPDPAALISEARKLGQARHWEKAARAARDAVTVLRQFGAEARGALAIALNEYAQYVRSGGAPEMAFEPAREAYELATALGAPDRILAVLGYNYGGTALDAGLPRPAIPPLDEAIRRFARSGDHSMQGRALTALGVARLALAEHETAVSLFEAAAAVSPAEGGARLSLRLARAFLALGDLEAAEQEIDEAERLSGAVAVDPEVVLARAELNIARYRYDEARAVLVELLQTGNLQEVTRASTHYKLGEIDTMSGGYAEAEENTRRALALYEKALGPGHHVFGAIFHRLGIIRQEYGDHANAIGFYDRALDIFATAFGEDHPANLDTRMERVRLLVLMGQAAEAIGEARAAVELLGGVAEASPLMERRRGIADAVLALALSEGGERAEAERAAKSAVRRFELQGARGRIDMVPSLNLLAEISFESGRTEEALAHARRAIAMQQELSAASPDRVAESRRILADILLATGEAEGALELARSNRDLIVERLEALSRRTSLSAEFRTGAARRQIGQLVEILLSIAGGRDNPHDLSVGEELFEAVQLLSLNQSAKALNAAVAKTVVTGEAATLIERRQRMAGEVVGLWRQAERLSDADGPLDVERLARIQLRIAKLEKTLTDADRELARVAPEYLALVKPRLRTLAETRVVLSLGEAVWMNASFDHGTLVFLVARDSVAMRWTAVSADRLDRIVADLRESIVIGADGVVPEFEPELAEALYSAVFAPIEDALKHTDSLILVPDGAAQQIPLGIALAPGDSDPTERYLGLGKAMSVVPSVDAFVALRAVSRPDKRIEGTFMGFGNPDFSASGGASIEGDLRLALASPKGFIENTDALRQVFRPLPETELELRYLADVMGTKASKVFLGADATETRVKSEDLSAVSVLAFATHAVASGEFDGSNEPGLALTPPATGSRLDDGFLTTSEIAQLSLSAELVILSACSTGSPQSRSGAEGLSGLARAFFRAGARSLLVSHWPVDSEATVYMTTQMAEAKRRDPSLTRAEAFRHALREVESGRYNDAFTHPFYWAPFFLVGDL